MQEQDVGQVCHAAVPPQGRSLALSLVHSWPGMVWTLRETVVKEVIHGLELVGY